MPWFPELGNTSIPGALSPACLSHTEMELHSKMNNILLLLKHQGKKSLTHEHEQDRKKKKKKKD
jgi:hypothetical protein